MTSAEFRAARRALGFSARAMGAALGGVTGRTVRYWEAGRARGGHPVPPPVAELVRRLLAERVEWATSPGGP